MAHPRKLVRHAVVALLVGVTAAGNRVQATRVEPHKKAQLPAIGVYTLRDPVNEDASTETEEAHELELEVVGWVAHTDATPVDDAMDDLAEEIETAMSADQYLGGKAGDSRLIETRMEVVEDDGRSSPLVGIVVLTYAITYRRDLTSTEATDDFKRVAATHQVDGADDDNTALDKFTVQGTDPWPDDEET